MEITKVVKPFIRSGGGGSNTFANIVYITVQKFGVGVTEKSLLLSKAA